MNDDQLKRARWRCRRGMRELDVLLNRFLDDTYSDLSTSERDLLDQVLDCSDMDLHAWLTGRATPDASEISALVERIKACV